MRQVARRDSVEEGVADYVRSAQRLDRVDDVVLGIADIQDAVGGVVAPDRVGLIVKPVDLVADAVASGRAVVLGDPGPRPLDRDRP